MDLHEARWYWRGAHHEAGSVRSLAPLRACCQGSAAWRCFLKLATQAAADVLQLGRT